MRDKDGNELLFFFKLGEKEHMEQFRQGKLYLNTLSYFRDLERDPERADRYEGTDRIYQPDAIEMTISFGGMPPYKIPKGDLAAPVTFSYHETACCNLLCLFCIRDPAGESVFSSEHKWFGDSVVVILNNQEFMRRLKSALQAEGFSAKGGLITYYDKASHNGVLGRFHKSSEYAHQQEYRIAVDTPGLEPLRLDIGDLSDITSEVIPLAVAKEALKFTVEDAKDAELIP